MLARKISIDHIELDDTDVAIPLGSGPGGSRLNLAGVSAQFLFFPEQIRISYFEGNVQGVRVVLKGELQNPQAFRLEHHTAPSGSSGPGNSYESLIKKFSELQYPGQPPEVRAGISGDLADLTTLQVSDISVRSGPVVAPEWRIEGLDVGADYQDGKFTVGNLLVRGREGSLNASAQWNKGWTWMSSS